MKLTSRVFRALLDTQPARAASAWAREQVNQLIDARLARTTKTDIPTPFNAARQIVLFYAPSMEPLARAISDASVDVGGRKIELGTISWLRFGNGFAHPEIKNANKLFDKDVAFLFDFNTEDDIYVQMSVARWIATRGPHSLTLLMPFYQNATMDRSDTEDVICMAETIAAQFLTIPAVRGPVPLWVMDVHALQEVHFLPTDHVTPFLDTAMNLFQGEYDPRTTAIAFPDEGAYKRYKNMFKAADGSYPYDFIVCGKVRDGDKRIVTVREGDPSKYERILTVDDLTHTGGTLIECLNALKARGARKVSAAIAHADFDRWNKARTVTDNGAAVIERIAAAGFETFHVTDTCPSITRQLEGRKPFKIHSIRDLAIKAIMRGAK